MDSAIRTAATQTSTPALPPGVDARLAAVLDHWRGAGPGAEPGAALDGFSLAWLVTARIRAVGREHLGEALLTALAAIQDRHRGRDRFLDAYLTAVLGRHQDRSAYLALPLLELIGDDPASHLTSDRLSALLMADVICRETLREFDARLDPTTRSRRAKHAGRFIAEAEPGLDLGVPAPPGTTAGEWLSLTALPVSTAHDEYFFIRALQAHELVFGMLTAEVRDAVEATRSGRPDGAAAAVRRADQVFRRAAALLRLLATTRAEDFGEFAEQIGGTGALQPEAHRPFERAFAELTELAALTDGAIAELLAGMAALRTSHRRWNTERHGFVSRLRGGETEQPLAA
jgi:hypothetical protein